MVRLVERVLRLGQHREPLAAATHARAVPPVARDLGEHVGIRSCVRVDRICDLDRVILVIAILQHRGVVVPPAEIGVVLREHAFRALAEHPQHVAGVAGIGQRRPHALERVGRRTSASRSSPFSPRVSGTR